MSSEPALVLAYKEPNLVIFRRNDDLNKGFWVELLRWWNNGSRVNEDSNEYTTTLEDYMARRVWFRTFWKANSRPVYVDSSLREAVKNASNVKEQFGQALAGNNVIDISKLNLTGLKRTLTKQQEYNVVASLNVPSGANFSVPGAGKTTATLALWNHLVAEGVLKKMLVVCPLSVSDSWMDDELVETFKTPPSAERVSEKIISSDSDIIVVNYEKLENETTLNKLCNWTKANQVMLVVDEAHRIKGGGKSVRWRACKTLAEHCCRVDLLTGTPMPQGYDDIRNLFKLSWKNLPTSALTDQQLSSLKPGGVFVRTTKSELNLPPIDIKEICINPSDKQAQIYSALRRSYSGLFNMSSDNQSYFSKKGAAVMTLIAAASNPGLIAGKEAESAYLNLKWPPEEISTDNELLDVVNNYVSYEIPPKYKWLKRFIDKSAQLGKKTVVWSSFVGNLRSIERLLKEYNPATIHGGVDLDERRIRISRFRNDVNCSVLITNPQTLGEGISLHKDCNQAVYLDRTFNAVHYLQSLDRIHRLGLGADVLTKVYVLTTKYTIDNRIDARLKVKIDRMATSLNDNSLNTSTYVTFDDQEDLLDLALDGDDESSLFEHLTSDTGCC